MAAITSALATAAPAQQAPLAEPQIDTVELTEPNYGDDEIVSMIAHLLSDENPLVREQAAHDLGETRNRSALGGLTKAFADSDVHVRITALRAVRMISANRTMQLITKALQDENPAMLLVAMRIVRDDKLSSAGPRTIELLKARDSRIRANALTTLSSLGIAANADALKTLLAENYRRVQIAAARNALLVKDARVLIEPLQGAAAAKSPALRSAAIEALGKFAFDSSQSLIASAANDNNPMVVSGAIRAYENAGKTTTCAKFLYHDSPAVRLAAIRATGKLTHAPSVAKLMTIMLDAPDKLAHEEARNSLLLIGGTNVEQIVARTLKLQKEMKVSLPSPPSGATEQVSQKHQMLLEALDARRVRNVASCCYMLGKLKSTEGFDYLLTVPAGLELDSPILLDWPIALAEIGDSRAIGPLNSMLDRCHTAGKKYLKTLGLPVMPPPYDGHVTGKAIEALIRLKSNESIRQIIKVTKTNIKNFRLTKASIYSARWLGEIADADRSGVDKTIGLIIATPSYELTARFYACKTAGRMKIKSALPALQTILNQERPGKDLMTAAAWAIQQITGQAPQIPQPRSRPGSWILTKLDMD